MKKILKSILVLSVVLGTTVGATRAWFTSAVTATNNEITAGTLLLGVATTQYYDSSGPGYNLAYDRLLADGGVLNSIAQFPVLENLAPGETRSVYFSVYNRGTLPLNFRFAFNGDWTLLPNHTSNVGLASRMKINNIRRVGYLGWVPGTEYAPYNIYTWLQGYGFVWDTEAVGGSWGLTSWNEYRVEGSVLASKELQVYEVVFMLDSEAPNAYQGGTFMYDIMVDAKQVAAPWN